jgi:hypothetical protein
MRTARVLKVAAYGATLCSAVVAFRSFSVSRVEFWVTIFLGFLVTATLRVVANMGQIIYDQRVELTRSAQNMERALYHSNALLKEIRDLSEPTNNA